ncbi:hypothetical protein BH09BAC4_BH09BAC4_11250 [soil metagenome]
MKKVVWLLSWLSFWIVSPQTVRASHIAGGNIELVATDKSGQFQLSLNLYIDDASKSPDAIIEPSIILSVFRNRDDQLMGDYTLKLIRKLLLVYANPACARTRGLQTSEVRYTALVQLDPNRFNDPAGYYVVWEKCCRNSNVVNIRNPESSGMIYYLSFPPLIKNGAPFRNSSPVFLTPNAEYICVNKPFSLAFRATDADGDELRYSLTTPYNDNIYKPAGFNNSPNSPPYRLLVWTPGFTAQQAITGDPPLGIDRSSGVLTVKPNRLGLFVFTVLCEEYRQGIKIGEVRRDHQILVVDCAPKVPPKPSLVAIDPAGHSPLEFCKGSAVVLQTDTDTTYNYQWQRDGYNLPGENKPELRTPEPGTYTVIKSFAIICTRDSISDTFKLILKPSPPAKITSPDTLFCPSRPIVLTANQQADFQYQWDKESTKISEATGPAYTVTEPGLYRLKIYNTTTECTSLDSVMVRKGQLQQATLTASGSQSLCEGNTLVLTTGSDTTRLTYAWTRNGTAIENTTRFLAKATVGDYAVTVTDTTQCTLTSATVPVNPRPKPVLDSLPPLCGPTALSLPLVASPPGGVFRGDGVTNNRFDPAVAGVGKHLIQYSLTNSFGCTGDTSRYVTVLNIPIVDLGLDRRINAGSTLKLDGPVGPDFTYQWEPNAGPTPQSDASSLTVHPGQTTTYRLTVLTDGICPVSDEVLIDVVPGLFIPTAFSPNDDGVNDTWMFTGIDAFPQCSVRIYDRWGELIFHELPYKKPWDGSYGGKRVNPGVYHFIIRPTPDQPEKEGTLMVL